MADLGLREIIGIVLALTFLALGVFLIRNSLSRSHEIVESEIDIRAEENIEQILNTKLEDDILVVSQNNFKLTRGKESTFLIGIKNADSSISELSMLIVNPSEEVSADDVFIYKKESVSLKPLSKEIFISKITIPEDMPDGSYIFEIRLMKGDERIKSKQIIVNVY